jgi:hypothetical protein
MGGGSYLGREIYVPGTQNKADAQDDLAGQSHIHDFCSELARIYAK